MSETEIAKVGWLLIFYCIQDLPYKDRRQRFFGPELMYELPAHAFFLLVIAMLPDQTDKVRKSD